MQHLNITVYNDDEKAIHRTHASTIEDARRTAKQLRTRYNAYFVQITAGQQVLGHYDRTKQQG
jgi:hypothetical protein